MCKLGIVKLKNEQDIPAAVPQGKKTDTLKLLKEKYFQELQMFARIDKSRKRLQEPERN